MRAALQSFLSGGRRGVTHAPVVELDAGVCPAAEPEGGGAKQRSASWFRASTSSRSSTLSAKSLDGLSRDDNLLSSYRRGDLDLLEACLTVIDNRHGIEPVLNKLASGGKVKAADWANALLQLGVDEDFVARFDDKPGAHDRAEHARAPDRAEQSGTLRRSNTTLSSRCSFVVAKTSSRRGSRASAAREEEAPADDLRRAFGLLSRLVARRRQREARGKLEPPGDLGSEDFQGTLDVAQKARDCAQHLARVAGARGPSAAALGPQGYAVLLLEHAAAAVRAGLYQKVRADLEGLLLLSELEPLLVVRTCIHGRPPAVQVLGWVIRSAAQELLTQERDAAICPDVFGSIELGLRLCFELTKLNKSLMRPPELHHASTAPSLSVFESLFSRRKVADSDAVASSAATAAERLLNIVHPRTVFLALAPAAFVADRAAVERLLRPGWGLLDEALIAEPSCKVRGGLAHVAKQMGISPPEPGVTVQRLSNSSRPGLDGLDQESAPSVADVAKAIGELEQLMGKKASMARSAALYGGAFLVQRALDQLERTRTRRRSSTADTRRTSVMAGLRRDSTDSIRHSTISGASRPSLDGVQDGQRCGSRAETWAGLASAHRLSDAMRPHLPPPFFEGRQGRVVPEPTEALRGAANAQLLQEADVLRGRGWLQPDKEWTDLCKAEAAKEDSIPKAVEAGSQDRSEESSVESGATAS